MTQRHAEATEHGSSEGPAASGGSLKLHLGLPILDLKSTLNYDTGF